MEAIRVRAFGEPEVLELKEMPAPQPGPTQLVIKVKAAGVNPVEAYIRSGKYTRLPALPYTPGTDAAGFVESSGVEVKAFRPGDRVYTFGSVTGTYAAFALCEESQVYRLPEPLSFAQGAALGIPAGTAWRALFTRGQAVPAETVLVHGATGGVGTCAVQLARAAGLTVIATFGKKEARQFLQQQGAQHVLSHEEANDPQVIKQLTDGKGVDLIVEMLANMNLGKDLSILSKHGRVVVVGSRGTVEIDPRVTMTGDLDIRGMALMNASAEELASMHAGIIASLEAGTLRPVVGQEMPLTDAPKAHHAILKEHTYGKIVLVP